MEREKPIYWVGSSHRDLCAFPEEARRDAGYQLHKVQVGLDPDDWKPFKSIGPGVREIRVREAGDAFRILYVAHFSDRIYVLHAFQKKSQKTSAPDIAVARTRFNAIQNEDMP